MAFNQTKFFDELEQLTLKTVEEKDYDEFIYRLLELLDKPKATITQLRNGSTRINVSKHPEAGEVALKLGIYYIPKPNTSNDELLDVLKEVKSSNAIALAKTRMLVVTNFNTVLLYDVRMDELIDVPFLELHKDYSFMLPLAGLERATEYSEHPADVKASEKMGRLFDQIKKNNRFDSKEELRELNTFLVRILFCLFAEDTGIFEKNQFHDLIQSTTLSDGSDTSKLLADLFAVLDSEPQSKLRNSAPRHLTNFPYVNGSLFKQQITIPNFDGRARRLLLNCAEMNWSDINPDIFGSMFQAVVDEKQRGSLGQHYTSVSDIMKVISPLFLDDIKEELEKIRGIHPKNASRDRKWQRLDDLHNRVASIKLFDAACGSGNFLIIAYKELRKVEIEILELKQERLTGVKNTPTLLGLESSVCSSVSLNNLYGIEYDDFASQIAKLALWLAEHQMNLSFREKFGFVPATLPLKDSGHIVHGNALRMDWKEVCPNNRTDEVYLVGNPPFGGTGSRSDEQSKDMQMVFKGFKSYKSLDYVSCWFWKGAQYIKGSKAKMALVSTNSVSQGTHVATIFPPIFTLGVEIEFAYQSFPWNNNAKNKASVHVIIIGLSNKDSINKKTIFSLVNKEWRSEIVDNISPYLVKGSNLAVATSSTPIDSKEPMYIGCTPLDGGNLLLSDEDKAVLLQQEPNAEKWLRPILGSSEFLNGKKRWCLWLKDITKHELQALPLVSARVEQVRQMRLDSIAESTRRNAKTPHLFGSTRVSETDKFILIPKVSSERRTYIPIGFVDKEVIVTDLAFLVCSESLYDFGVLTSLAHNDWMRLVAGRLKSDYRYSSTVVYNTFPFPEANNEQKANIRHLAEEILMAREAYPNKTLAELYDPNKMPSDLLNAHRMLDKAVDELYKAGGFRNASERVEHLLKLYEKKLS